VATLHAITSNGNPAIMQRHASSMEKVFRRESQRMTNVDLGARKVLAVTISTGLMEPAILWRETFREKMQSSSRVKSMSVDILNLKSRIHFILSTQKIRIEWHFICVTIN
jgi:hypothetical protein